MQQETLPINSILIQGATLEDLERMIYRAVKQEIGMSAKESNNPAKEIKLLSRRETAKLLMISLPTLSSWTKIGVIKSRTIGRSVYYTQQDIDDALKIGLKR